VILLALLLACHDKAASDDSAAAETGCADGAPGTWYADADADGHGDPASATTACEAPPFAVEVGDDCDDHDASAHPGASETCDGADDDCDGEIDQGLETGTWWEDGDGDGYGDPTSEVSGCLPPPDPADNGEDCDDGDALTYPGAPETCGDGRLNDCGAGAADCDLSGTRTLSSAFSVLYGEAEDARAGEVLLGPGDLDGDGARDLLVAAPRDPEGGVYAGAVYAVSGPPPDEAVLSESTAKLVGEQSNGYAGLGLAAGDLDGDGLLDVAVGEPGVRTDGNGLTALVLGPLSGEIALTDADLRLGGGTGSSLFGACLLATDLDDDDQTDLAVADPHGDQDGQATGWVALLPGPLDAETTLDGAARLWGQDAGDYAGVAMAGGADVDGDGVDDLLVGGPYQAEAGTEAGSLYLLFGPVTADGMLADADRRWTGEDEGDFAGRALALADVDGDGRADVVIGGAGSDDNGDGAGAVWIVRGPALEGGSVRDGGTRYLGELEHDAAGQELARAGDVDGDGMEDLAIGAPGADLSGAFSGTAYLLCAPEEGSHDLSEARAAITGIDRDDSAGIAVAGPGDLDGDGVPDLAVGAYGVDTVADWAGAAYVVPGAGY